MAKCPGPNDADAFFACLALSMEKLTKLTLGLDGVVRVGGWPSLETMMDRKHRHSIDRMDEEIRGVITANAETATHPQYVVSTLAELSQDPWIDRAITDGALRPIRPVSQSRRPRGRADRGCVAFGVVGRAGIANQHPGFGRGDDQDD